MTITRIAKHLFIALLVTLITAPTSSAQPTKMRKAETIRQKSTGAVNLKTARLQKDQEVAAVKASLDQVKPEAAYQCWADVFEASKNKAIQIFAHGYTVDLMRPYIKYPTPQGRGSGFLLNAEGRMCTNFHVVRGSNLIQVRFPFLEQESFTAKFEGAIPRFDMAIIQLLPSELVRLNAMLAHLRQQNPAIPATLEFFELGDSDELQVNSKVMIIGHPLGLEKIDGIRGIMRSETRTENGLLFTIDGAINAGNSGSATLNKSGKVVGIVVSGMSGSEGMNHIIPINRLKLFMNEMHDGKIIGDAFWGMRTTPTTQSTLTYLNNPDDGGVLISKVARGSLAETAGIQEGDVLYAINNALLDRFGQTTMAHRTHKIHYTDVLAKIKNNDPVMLTIYRSGEKKDFLVTKTEAPLFGINSFYYPFTKAPEFDVFGGMVIVSLTQNHLDALESVMSSDSSVAQVLMPYVLDYKKRYDPKLIITSTFPETEIGKCGVFDAGIISTINGKKVGTISQLHAAILHAKNPEYLVVELEGGSFTALKMADIMPIEPQLSQVHNYPLSPLWQQLLDKYCPAEEPTNETLAVAAELDSLERYGGVITTESLSEAPASPTDNLPVEEITAAAAA